MQALQSQEGGGLVEAIATMQLELLGILVMLMLVWFEIRG